MKGSAMNTNTSRVVDRPVARATDPIDSYLAGENQTAREASERIVVSILAASERAMSAHAVETVAAQARMPWTGSRYRTAIKQLVRKGIVTEAGRKPHASPTGRSAMTYTLAEVSK